METKKTPKIPTTSKERMKRMTMLRIGNRPLAKCEINITEFLKRVRNYTRPMKEGGLLVNPQVFKKVEKRIVSVFVVDKRARKICLVTKNTVVKSLEHMEVNLRRIMKDSGFFMWNILLPTPDNSVKAVKCDLSTKNLILKCISASVGPK